MTFTAPLFLLAAIAAAIPIVLHMIDQQKAKELPFSTLRFLKISVQKTRRRKRVHDLLLMVIRAAMLLLIAAALARPAVTSFGKLWGGSRSAVVIILDNSASMGVVDQDRERFDTAVAAATQVLDQLTEGDQTALMVTCGPVFPASERLDRTQDAVRQVLLQCRVSYERAHLAQKVHQARELLAKSDAPNRQIYVLTDMQKLSWEELGDGGRGTGDGGSVILPSPSGRGAGGEGDTLQSQRALTLTLSQRERGPSGAFAAGPSPFAPLILVDCNRAPKPNVAVQGVAIDAAAPIAGMPVRATVTLLNASTVARQPRVELLIDGTKEASSPELTLPPEGQAKHEFEFTLRNSGLHRGEVRLVGEDGSKYDDRRFFAMQVEQSIPVAIVRSKRHEIPYLDDAYYLDQALSPGQGDSAIQPTSLVADDLMSEPLEKYKLIFCVNLPALNSDAAERLAAYVARGGNLVWFCGDNVNPEAYSQMDERAKHELLPAPLVDVRAPGRQDNRDSWHISFLDRSYPAFRHLAEPAALYESVLVYKHVRMEKGQRDGGLRVLARLDDGEPLLTLRNVEKGKVLMCGTSAHVSWSNLPLRPIFLPLLVRLTFELAQAEQTMHNLLAGQPLMLRLPDESHSVGVEIVPPNGEMLRLKTESVAGQPGQSFRYTNTHEIGVYLVRLLNTVGSTPMAYAINGDPDEADPTTISREDLQTQLGPTPLVFAENPDDLSSTFAMLRQGKSLWTPFLAAVLVFLVFETFLSNRLSPKPGEQLAHQPPPGLRRLATKAASPT